MFEDSEKNKKKHWKKKRALPQSDRVDALASENRCSCKVLQLQSFKIDVNAAEWPVASTKPPHLKGLQNSKSIAIVCLNCWLKQLFAFLNMA